MSDTIADIQQAIVPKRTVRNRTTLTHTPTSFWLLKHSSDAFTLYHFYCYMASWQGHNPVRATRSFTLIALHWGKTRYTKAKLFLKRAHIIKDITRRAKSGQSRGSYILVRLVKWDSIFNSVKQEASNTASSLRPPNTSKDRLNTHLESAREKYLFRFGSQFQGAVLYTSSDDIPDFEDDTDFSEYGDAYEDTFDDIWEVDDNVLTNVAKVKRISFADCQEIYLEVAGRFKYQPDHGWKDVVQMLKHEIDVRLKKGLIKKAVFSRDRAIAEYDLNLDPEFDELDRSKYIKHEEEEV